MTITSSKLFRAAGLSAALAGLLYVFIQFIHPHEDLATVTTTAWVVVAGLTALMALSRPRRHHGHLPAAGRARWACSA